MQVCRLEWEETVLEVAVVEGMDHAEGSIQTEESHPQDWMAESLGGVWVEQLVASVCQFVPKCLVVAEED